MSGFLRASVVQWQYREKTLCEDCVIQLSTTNKPCHGHVLTRMRANSLQCHADASLQPLGPVLAQEQLCSFPLWFQPRAFRQLGSFPTTRHENTGAEGQNAEDLQLFCIDPHVISL